MGDFQDRFRGQLRGQLDSVTAALVNADDLQVNVFNDDEPVMGPEGFRGHRHLRSVLTATGSDEETFYEVQITRRPKRIREPGAP